jgi:hypothetical protein
MSRQGLSDRAGFVKARPDGVSHHVGHRLGILLVVQQVSGNP